MEHKAKLVVFTATATVAAIAAGLWFAAPTAANSDPNDPPPPQISGILPVSVTLPSSVTTDVEGRPFFDQFSWQSFIALNWPADPNAPGTPLSPSDPSVFKTPPAGSSTVWESYMASFQLYGTGDQPPVPWGSATQTSAPCGSGKTLRMVAKASDVLNEVNEAFSHPLIDQNNNYVYAEVRFNQAYYDFVSSNGFYLKKNLPLPSTTPMQMPVSSSSPYAVGAVMIKAAWRQLTATDDPSRYYVIDAQLAQSGGQGCVSAKMGLVGLHVAQKAKGFPAWIWSSFEQIDNVAPGPGAGPNVRASFNNGTDTPATPNGWANRPPKAPPLLAPGKRSPVQVTRYNAIPTTPPGKSTVDLNTAYAALVAGTPWQNYQLVITQWPTDNAAKDFLLLDLGGIYPQNGGQPFPVNGATNTAMETYFQAQADAIGSGGNSCMQCHYSAGKTDFSWIMQNDSH
jgi:hypothetical protein